MAEPAATPPWWATYVVVLAFGGGIVYLGLRSNTTGEIVLGLFGLCGIGRITGLELAKITKELMSGARATARRGADAVRGAAPGRPSLPGTPAPPTDDRTGGG